MKPLHRSLRKSQTPTGAATSKRLEETIESTEYWARRMPREAVRLLRRERVYGIAGGVLSLLTGVLVWPACAELSTVAVPALLSGLCGLAALAIAAPYMGGLSDRSEDSIKLSGAYGEMNRELLRAREQAVAGSMEHSVQLPELFGQFDRVEEFRDSLGIPVRPAMVSVCGVPFVKEVERPVRAIRIASGKCVGRPVRSARVGSGRTVVVDEEAVATLIYVLASQLAEGNKNSTIDFPRHSFPLQSDMSEEVSMGRYLEPHGQLALPCDSSRTSDSAR